MNFKFIFPLILKENSNSFPEWQIIIAMVVYQNIYVQVLAYGINWYNYLQNHDTELLIVHVVMRSCRVKLKPIYEHIHIYDLDDSKLFKSSEAMCFGSLRYHIFHASVPICIFYASVPISC